MRTVRADVNDRQVSVPVGPIERDRTAGLRAAAAEFSLNELEAFLE
jgi:hypothetical protein